VILAIFAPSVAYAQAQEVSPEAQAASPSDDTSSGGLADIVVTAQKRSENINKVPISITAATSEQLQNLGIRNAADLSRLVPSFQATQSFNANPVYTLRGIGFFDAALGSRPTVAIYQDQIELPFAIMSRGATLDLERVEVLKGPQGTLFGQNATGGLVNYIAAKPTDEFHFGGAMTFGRFAQGTAEGYLSGPISDTLSVRVAAKHDFGGDWQRSYTTDQELGQRNLTSVRAILAWEPTDNFSLSLNLNGWKDRSDTQAGALVRVALRRGTYPELENYPVAPRDPRAADFTRGENSTDLDFRQASLRAEFEAGIGTLTSLSSFSYLNGRVGADADGTTLRNISTDDRVLQKNFTQELRLAGKLADRLTYLVGGSYGWYRANQTEFQIFDESTSAGLFSAFGPIVFAGLGVFNNARFETTSAFGSLDYTLSDALVLHGGIRYTKTTANAVGCSFDNNSGAAAGFGTLFNFLRGFSNPLVSIPAGGCFSANSNYVPGPASQSFKEDSVPFKVGVDWNVTNKIMLYANMSRGFKGGSFPIISSSAQIQFEPATQEKLTAYEVGFKAKLANTLQFNAAGFYYDYKDKQATGAVLDPVSGPLQKIVNIPKSAVYGAEAQITYAPFDGLLLNGGGTYLNAKIKGCGAANVPATQPGCQASGYFNYDSFGSLVKFTSDIFPNAPKLSGVIDAEYKWMVGDRREAFFGTSARAQSKTIGQLGTNRALGAADPNRSLRIDGFATLDLRAGIDSEDGRWRLTVWGRNVTNKYYRVASQVANDTVIAITGMPVTYGITFAIKN
jgi:outer membrane receptor protein involved in Fe transport